MTSNNYSSNYYTSNNTLSYGNNGGNDQYSFGKWPAKKKVILISIVLLGLVAAGVVWGTIHESKNRPEVIVAPIAQPKPVVPRPVVKPVTPTEPVTQPARVPPTGAPMPVLIRDPKVEQARAAVARALSTAVCGPVVVSVLEATKQIVTGTMWRLKVRVTDDHQQLKVVKAVVLERLPHEGGKFEVVSISK